MIKRAFDITLCVIIFPILLLPIIFVATLIRLSSSDPVIYWSRRVGQNNKIFLMPKFRTMSIAAPEVATDELKNPDLYITKVGKILRKTSLDELPQVYSIFIGEMSWVGPRPSLESQKKLVEFRSSVGISSLRPGLTGLAQINGRDNISEIQKCKYDEIYLKTRNISLDIKILLKTFFSKSLFSNVKH